MIVLETERLLLRHLEISDVDDLYALYRDPEMRRYFPDGTLTYEETKEEVTWYLNGHPRHPELGLWAAVLKADGRFIGRCGLLLWRIDDVDEIEVAYLIDKRYWGQGLGGEAARGIRDYAFGHLKLPRLVCLIDENNAASIKVAERMGMVFEREGEDELGPFLLYAMSNPDR
ncbi:MAG: GNAT family N-acetyltransferase [Caldilineaceae bacterium]|nr:GNAT family N-acetyltransferase [Caldilineaceae bacterium]